MIGFSLFTNVEIGKDAANQSIAYFSKENIIHTLQPTKQIELVSGNQTLAVDGTQAKVEYDKNGYLKVNKQSIVVIKSTNILKTIPIFNQLRVPYGKRVFLTLSDGSSLWVNTGTTVVYSITFAKENIIDIFDKLNYELIKLN